MIWRRSLLRFFSRRTFSTAKEPENNTKYFENVRRRFFYESRLKTGLIIGGTLFALSAVGWLLFQDKFRSVAVREATMITQKSLKDEELQHRVNEIAAASTKMIINDPIIYAQLILLLKVVANDPEIAQSTSLLLQKAIRMPEFKALLIKSLTELLHDEQTRQATTDIAKQIFRNLLQDESLKQELILYLQSVAKDASLQETVGNSMWTSTKIAFVPRFLRW